MSAPSHSVASLPSARALELRAIGRLAVPLVLANGGNALMGLVDTLMVGSVGKAALTGVGVGNSLFFTLTLLALGCVMGMDAPASQAIGAGEPGTARRVLWQGVRAALVTGVLSALVIAVAPLFLESFGVKEDAAAQARIFVWVRLPQIFGLLPFVACRGYLQAVGKTRPIVVAIIVANVANLVLNYLFIHGDAGLVELGLWPVGLPAMGAAGSALSSVLAQFLSLVILARAISAVECPPDPQRRSLDRALRATIYRLGIPLGLQTLAEIAVFAVAAFFAAGIATHVGAAHQVALSMASLTFMMTVGIGAATSIRVGHAVGRGDSAGARRAGFLGLGVGAAFMSVSATVFLLLPEWLAQRFTDDPEVVAAALPLIRIAAIFQLFDGLQAVASGALRGAGDSKVPLYANLAAYWAVAFPLMLWNTYGLHLGAEGLWWALTAGLVLVSLALTARFHVLSRREIQRVVSR